MTNSGDAKAPFDHAAADIILRSSDGVDFRIFKLFLSLASSFFETLFNLPQPPEAKDQEFRDGLPVIPVTEDSKILDVLLRCCYPCTLVESPNLQVLDTLEVLEAARKYSLDAIEKKAYQAIMNPQLLAADPLRCFVIARRGGLREGTQLAARYTLTQPLIPSWFQEIEMLTTTDLLSLLTYHKKCGEAVYALRLDLSWITSHYGNMQGCFWLSSRHSQYNCWCPKPNTSRYKLFELSLPQWWDDFMEETFTALRDKPCKETVQASAEMAVQRVKARNCQACNLKITGGMRDLVDLIARKTDETVTQVELKLSF
ncbi:hypothetical protein OG21DRAFT_1483690 [Imleria badia]|nr:hypothetical protein OG21DRAFT_1483690 [Imleria badia]